MTHLQLVKVFTNCTKDIIETFSNEVFRGYGKLQTARCHVTKPCGHIRSFQSGFPKSRSGFSHILSDSLECFLS